MFVTQQRLAPHDEIFEQQTRAHAAYSTHQVPQHHVHKASMDKQYSPIQSRMHLHDTVSAPVANGTLIHLSGTFFIVNISKACIPEPTGKPTCVILYRGSISLSLSLFFLFSFFLLPFHHHHHLASFPSHHHGARSTADGSRVMDGVECKCGTS